MKDVGLEDGMSRRASEEWWQYENRYDRDNKTTSDSDNDGNVDGGQKQHLLSTCVSNM